MNKNNYFEDDYNFILATDSYKESHPVMLPDGLTYLESYAEARGGDFPLTAITGYLPYLRMISGVQVTQEKLEEAKIFLHKHFGTDKIFQEHLWQIIIDEHGGKIPLKIYAVPEGTVLPQQNVIFKTVPTDPRFADLASHIETYFMRLWYSFTVSTNSMYAGDLARYYYKKTADDDKYDGWKFLLHDFGSRGVASREQSQIGGAAHLMTFKGSDNIDGIRYLMKHYDYDNWKNRNTDNYLINRGFSVPASEHLVMTIRGRDDEEQVYYDLLKKFSEGELNNVILSVVSDSFDVYERARRLYEHEGMRKLIQNRNANFVFRPDSGEAFNVLPKLLNIFSDTFGFHINSKGYKVLNNNIKLLQGDGIDLESYHGLILYLCDELKWSIDNFVFGSGGGLLQAFDRDTIKFAIKCSHAVIDGEEIDVYKDPIDGSKKSKKGKLWLFRDEQWNYHTYNEQEMSKRGLSIEDGVMIPVFENGEVLVDYGVDEIVEGLQYEYNQIETHFEKNHVKEYIEATMGEINKETKYLKMLEKNEEEQKLINATKTRINNLENELTRLQNL